MLELELIDLYIILYNNYYVINARRMREGYCNHPVCLCVCVSVCYHPSAYIRRVCDKIGLPV